MIEITKFKPSDRASAEVFNKRLEEIEKYINDMEKENKKLKEQLDNKVEKTDKTVYKKLQDVQGENVNILDFVKKLKSSGYFQLFYNNKNAPPTGNWDWAYAEVIYQNENAIHLKLTTLFPPYSIGTCHYINGSWQNWVVV